MSIEIRHIETEEGQITCPVFVCDQCHQVITDGSWALYQWKTFDQLIIEGSLAILHKKDCADAWEEAHEGLGSWSNMELNYLPIYLGNNIGIDWDEAFKGAGNMQSI